MLPTTDQLQNKLITRLKNYVDANISKVNNVRISSGNASIEDGTLYIELPDDSEEPISRADIAALIAANA